LIAEADLNKDGVLTFEEFKKSLFDVVSWLVNQLAEEE
jgi:Ca2+-binding EF-hand superfamily protein